MQGLKRQGIWRFREVELGIARTLADLLPNTASIDDRGVSCPNQLFYDDRESRHRAFLSGAVRFLYAYLSERAQPELLLAATLASRKIQKRRIRPSALGVPCR
jgi:hypothetical protein